MDRMCECGSDALSQVWGSWRRTAQSPADQAGGGCLLPTLASLVMLFTWWPAHQCHHHMTNSSQDLSKDTSEGLPSLGFHQRNSLSFQFYWDTEGWQDYLVAFLFSVPKSLGSNVHLLTGLVHRGCHMLGLWHRQQYPCKTNFISRSFCLGKETRDRDLLIVMLMSKNSNAPGPTKITSNYLRQSHKSKHSLITAL